MDFDFFNKVDREREYKKYLVFHIGHVEDNFHRLIEPLKGKYGRETDDAIDLCGQYIMLHDLSKLSKDEFDAYRVHFYPTEKETREKADTPENWDAAKRHHYMSNPHHAYYWVKGDEKRDMPLNYIFEMLCDWASVSQWYDSSIIDWYDKDAKKEKDAFTDGTREIVDFWFDEIFRKPGLKY